MDFSNGVLEELILDYRFLSILTRVRLIAAVLVLKIFYDFEFEGWVLDSITHTRIQHESNTYSENTIFFLTAVSKLELESNSSEICQLIVSLAVVLPQFDLTKLKLENLNSGFMCCKEWYKHRWKKFCIISSSAQVFF